MSKDTHKQAGAGEAVEIIEAIEAPVVNEPVKLAYFFPNSDQDAPFGGEFASRQEAEAANEKYLKSLPKKETK